MVLKKNKKITSPLKRKLSASDLVVLSLLAEEPMHGYWIVHELQRRDAKDWVEISRPQVYYSLKKLLQLHFISISPDLGETMGPEREIYQINAAGMAAMDTALGTTLWAEQRPPPPFLTWMALSSHVSSEVTKAVIKARQQFLMKELVREQKTLTEFGENNDKMITSGRLMVVLTIEQFKLELKWLEQVRRELPKTRVSKRRGLHK